MVKRGHQSSPLVPYNPKNQEKRSPIEPIGALKSEKTGKEVTNNALKMSSCPVSMFHQINKQKLSLKLHLVL
jgi:hypothetical protein